MRLTVCLEDNAEGRVLASVDMEEIVKMTITDDIEKSNFNPQMLKSCTDTSYQCGYEQGKADAIEECTETIRKGFEELLQSPWANTKYLREFDFSVKEVFEVIDHLILRKDLEQLKEQKNDC